MATRTSADVDVAPTASILALPAANALRLSARMNAALERLGIVTIRDLIRHFPYRYEDLLAPSTIADILARRPSIANGESNEQNALGVVTHCKHVRLRGRIRAKTSATLDDGTGLVQAVWYGRPYLASQMNEGDRVFVRGRVEHTLTGATINVSRHRVLKAGEPYAGELVPVYPQTAGLTGYELRRLVRSALRLVAADPSARAELDPLPAAINKREHFTDAWRAIQTIHNPQTLEAAAEARRRLVYEEFFLLATASALRRAERVAEAAPDFHGLGSLERVNQQLHAELRSLFPFHFTGAQERVVREVTADLLRRSPMNRLLQGDVGSGKTAVAIAAILVAAKAGYQSAFMAPTEVLAFQQFHKMGTLLSHAGLRVALVTGALKKKTRDDILEQLRHGDLHVVIGTHALITDDVQFAKLGLVIIDEQHRFGVLQRAALRAKAHGLSPHTLVMTATPIPRTLAQTVYADLDVSILDELPPGRRPVKTYVRGDDAKEKVLTFVRREVGEGRQAFVVCPAIDESERALQSAVQAAEELKSTVFSGLQVALLHGRMSVSQKDEIMRLFADGFIKILISTSVIEVGVDIPNASVMLVLDAHAFGLAQLHQLRGRVGRGPAQSYCILVSSSDEAARLRIMAATNDGFVIAEEDLKIRGSGDLVGTRQHGGHELRLAHLIRDFPIFVQAKKAAEAVVHSDPQLALPANRRLAAFIAGHDRAAALRVSS